VPRPARLFAFVAGSLVALACNPSKNAFQLGVPGSRVEMNVARATPRFGILDTELHGAGWTLHTYLPASARCQRVVAGETGVAYLSSGPYGTLLRGNERCAAIGIGSLREWRNRRPRSASGGAAVIPSAQASYRRVFEDEEVVFLRGNFPLASLLGFAGLGDTIAVVPRVAVCQRAIESTTSTLEFFHAGRNVLTLSSADGRCNILGLVRPPAPADLGTEPDG
jgi:hypothetical protein